MEQSSHPPLAAAERAALRSARSSARADGSSGSAGCGAELFLRGCAVNGKKKSSPFHGLGESALSGRVPPPGEPAKGERTTETRGDAPHSGVREALLAPMAAPALPDAARSSSCAGEEKRKSSDPGTYFEFWWARLPPSLSYA